MPLKLLWRKVKRSGLMTRTRVPQSLSRGAEPAVRSAEGDVVPTRWAPCTISVPSVPCQRLCDLRSRASDIRQLFSSWLADRCLLESTHFFSQCFLSILLIPSISLRPGTEALSKMDTSSFSYGVNILVRIITKESPADGVC